MTIIDRLTQSIWPTEVTLGNISIVVLLTPASFATGRRVQSVTLWGITEHFFFFLLFTMDVEEFDFRKVLYADNFKEILSKIKNDQFVNKLILKVFYN